MRARKTGRFLAPLALVAVIVATVLVVRAGLATTHHPAARAPTLPVSHPRVARRRFYRIRPGDTLSTISVKTGVSVPELQQLNPATAADPNALQTGQRLRLR